MSVPWYAVAIMLAGPAVLGLARIVISLIERRARRTHRPGYLDLRR